ncbi:MAG: PEP-CTERM sorting domain-containing protein [Anaerolineaceae bacterium]|nr:PEP-CTERM sorting domain-containing protein [Anaerolineaceae bacterium]
MAADGDYLIIVPEPATTGMIVAGLAGLVARRRRRK